MACRFTIDGKTYEEEEFKAYLHAMPVADAAKYMPDVRAMPAMPFEKTWHEVALKKMLRYAAENNYDRLSWDTGETNAARYDLSQQVESIRATKIDNGKINIKIEPKGGNPMQILVGKDGIVETMHNNEFTGKSLADVVGKEMADKISNDMNEGAKVWGVKNRSSGNWSSRFASKEEAEAYQRDLPASIRDGTDVLEMTPRTSKEYTGLDLKVGGEGMKGFYDKILPSFVNKYAKKWGAKVEDSTIQGDREHETPYRVASSGKEYWVEDRNGKVISQKFDTAIKAMDERDSMMVGPKVHSIPITEAMRASVMEGQPLFSPKITGADRETEKYTPEQIEAYKNVGRITDPPSIRERLNTARQDLGKRIIRYWLDPYIGVKAEDPNGYMALRNANSVGGAVEMFLTDGRLKFDGSTYAMADRNGGVEHLLIRPLQGEQDRFLWWVAANRAERLSAEDRENLWTPEDIAAIKSTNQGTVPFDYQLPNGSITHSREAIYLDSLKKLDLFNKNTMDLAVESGILPRGKVDALWSNPFYVPFYRDAENNSQFVGPRPSAQFVKQNAFKTLTGGTEKLNHDLWQNALGNWMHLIDASLRNRAAVRVLDVAANSANDAAREVTQQEIDHQMTKEQKANVVWVMKGGEKHYYEITDPFLHSAITALDFTGFHNPIMHGMQWFKKILTMGVTSDPRFMLRIAIRDSEQAIATAPMSYNIVSNLITGFKMNDVGEAVLNVGRALAARDLERQHISDEAANAIAGGAAMRLGSGQESGFRKTNLDTMLDSPGKIQSFWHYVSTVARAYKGVTALGEDVNRLALYHKLIADGVPHDAAAFAGRDLEDFTLKGAGAVARTLTQSVAFMNAWAQGLYKVGRAASDADRSIGGAVAGQLARSTTRRVAVVVGATAMASLALDAIYKDDEDYKKRTDDDRNSNFWFKFGGTAYRIPMGFEIAALARIAANGAEVFYDKEMTGRRFINNFYSMLLTNMAMNPIPQAVHPIYDLATNTSGTGSPIEPMGMENLQSQERYTSRSTLAARGISDVGSKAVRGMFGPQAQFLSPIQIDYLTQGYFGWLGAFVTGTADRIAREALSATPLAQPVRPSMDLWNFATGGMVSTQSTAQSRYTDMLYQQADGINKAYGTYMDLLHRQQPQEAQQYFKDNLDQMIKHKSIDKLTKFESEANQRIRFIENNTKLSADQKRVQIMQLNAMKNRAAENMFGAH